MTDGWYSIRAHIDEYLSSFIQSGRIKVGTKLLCNAELVGSEEGIDPLDFDESKCSQSIPMALELHANSTRLAKWDSKLGFVNPKHFRQGKGFFMIKSLNDVIPGGGPLPLVDVLVCRKYNRLFYRKYGSFDNDDFKVGKATILTEAEEERFRKERDNRREELTEKKVDSLEKEALNVCANLQHILFFVSFH